MKIAVGQQETLYPWRTATALSGLIHTMQCPGDLFQSLFYIYAIQVDLVLLFSLELVIVDSDMLSALLCDIVIWYGGLIQFSDDLVLVLICFSGMVALWSDFLGKFYSVHVFVDNLQQVRNSVRKMKIAMGQQEQLCPWRTAARPLSGLIHIMKCLGDYFKVCSVSVIYGLMCYSEYTN